MLCGRLQGQVMSVRKLLGVPENPSALMEFVHGLQPTTHIIIETSGLPTNQPPHYYPHKTRCHYIMSAVLSLLRTSVVNPLRSSHFTRHIIAASKW